MDEIEKFKNEVKENILKQGEDKELKRLSHEWFFQASKYNYAFHYTFMGRPIIQHPQDMIARQELIWQIKPDLIIDSGIAHGGSLIMNAGYLEMMGIENGHVLGLDIDIRAHNRREIESHPMFKRITMLEGSSTADEIYQQVLTFAKDYKTIMVSLDSNHTHAHVLRELELYAPLVTVGSYCVVYDTTIEDFPESSFADRPWDIGNNPKTAVREFLTKNDDFEIDTFMDSKLLISEAPEGYLKRVK